MPPTPQTEDVRRLLARFEGTPTPTGPGDAYLRSRGFEAPYPSDVRWLPRLDWPEELRGWLTPTRTYDGPRGTGLGPDTQVRADHGYPALCAGLLVWIWRRLPDGVPGVEVEGVSDEGRRVEFRRPGGSNVKRPAVPGSRFDGAAFIARASAPGVRLHVCEGAPDALAAVTLGLATPGEGVIAAHGAGQLPSLAPWCASRPVTIWPHGDHAGERGARALRDRLRERVRVHFGRGDLGDELIGQEPARVPDSWEGDG